MAEKLKRTVFFKQSGERLGEGNPGSRDWTHQGVSSAAEKLGKLHEIREELGIEGITVVLGAGNRVRGRELKEQKIAPGREDYLGRMGTIENTIVLSGALEEINVPHLILLTRKMSSSGINFNPPTYSAKLMVEAHQKGQIVLIAGGTGEDNVTTDNAVVFYAHDHQLHSGGEVLILKGTSYDGVFEDDPRKIENPRRFRKIGAPTMLADYERFAVVDEASLKLLVASGLSMLVYSYRQHELEDVLHDDLTWSGDGPGIGTLILPSAVEPVYY